MSFLQNSGFKQSFLKKNIFPKIRSLKSEFLGNKEINKQDENKQTNKERKIPGSDSTCHLVKVQSLDSHLECLSKQQEIVLQCKCPGSHTDMWEVMRKDQEQFQTEPAGGCRGGDSILGNTTSVGVGRDNDRNISAA